MVSWKHGRQDRSQTIERFRGAASTRDDTSIAERSLCFLCALPTVVLKAPCCAASEQRIGNRHIMSRPMQPSSSTSIIKLVRAAQYVRMSTEHQQYSTQNQMDAIA